MASFYCVILNSSQPQTHQDAGVEERNNHEGDAFRVALWIGILFESTNRRSVDQSKMCFPSLNSQKHRRLVCGMGGEKNCPISPRTGNNQQMPDVNDMDLLREYAPRGPDAGTLKKFF
jgi:hypothetical protein